MALCSDSSGMLLRAVNYDHRCESPRTYCYDPSCLVTVALQGDFPMIAARMLRDKGIETWSIDQWETRQHLHIPKRIQDCDRYRSWVNWHNNYVRYCTRCGIPNMGSFLSMPYQCWHCAGMIESRRIQWDS